MTDRTPAMPPAPGRFRRAWRKLWRGGWILLCLVIGSTAVRIVDPLLVEAFRLWSFDRMQAASPRPSGEPDVVVIDFDEASLRQIGQWPWSRRELAELLIDVTDAGAVIAGFTVFFEDPDRLSPPLFAARTPGIDPVIAAGLDAMPVTDEIFAHVLARARAVLGVVAGCPDGPVRPHVNRAEIATLGANPRPYLMRVDRIQGDLPPLAAAAGGIGMLNSYDDFDGVSRRIPAVTMVRDAIYPALPIEMLRVAFGVPGLLIRADELGVRDVVLATVGGPAFVIPTDRNGQLWLHAARHSKARYIPAHRIASGRFDPKLVAGKIVLFGTSATGLTHTTRTALGEVVPTVEIQAQVLEGIMNNDLLVRPNWVEALERILPLAVGIALLTCYLFLQARWMFPVSLVVGSAALGTSWYLFSSQRLLIDGSFVVLSALLLLVASLIVTVGWRRVDA